MGRLIPDEVPIALRKRPRKERDRRVADRITAVVLPRYSPNLNAIEWQCGD